MRIPIHYCWIQGIDALPDDYRANLARWREVLPDGFKLHGWDHRSALSDFPFYAAHHAGMSHHAMRADVILLSAQVRYGGLVIGIDMVPNQSESLFSMMRQMKSFAIQDRRGDYYNGLSFAATPFDSRFVQILDLISMLPARFHETHVPAATGPLRWTSILKNIDHDLVVIPDGVAWTRSYWEPSTTRPIAWVDPGFANSHQLIRAQNAQLSTP